MFDEGRGSHSKYICTHFVIISHYSSIQRGEINLLDIPVPRIYLSMTFIHSDDNKQVTVDICQSTVSTQARDVLSTPKSQSYWDLNRTATFASII